MGICGNQTVAWEDGLLMPSRRQVSCGKMGEMGIRNLPGWLAGGHLPQISSPSLARLPHPQTCSTAANVLITWNFDDLYDSHADDMVQAYRYDPNQSSERGTDQGEAGSRGTSKKPLWHFSQHLEMDATPPPPAYSCRRRQSAVSLNSLDLDVARRRPFLIYAGKPRNCAISTHCQLARKFLLSQLFGGNTFGEKKPFHLCQLPT